jgi:hypothetical protein
MESICLVGPSVSRLRITLVAWWLATSMVAMRIPPLHDWFNHLASGSGLLLLHGRW